MSLGTWSSLVPEAVAARIESLPPLPRVAERVLALTRREEASLSEIRLALEADPALTAALLRLANSALFAPRTPVGDAGRAVVMLGRARVAGLVLATVVAGLRAHVPPAGRRHAERLWEHSAAVAIASRVVAESVEPAIATEAFTAGLLHDVGRLALLAAFPDECVALLEECVEGGFPSPRREREALGASHELVGALLLGRWGLPDACVEVAGRHHVEPCYESQGPRPLGPLASIVAEAEALLIAPDDDLGEEAAEVSKPSGGPESADHERAGPTREALLERVAAERPALMAL